MSRNDLYTLLLILILAAASYLVLSPGRENDGSIIIAGPNGVIYETTFERIRQSGPFSRDFACATGTITFSFSPETGVKVEKASCPDKLCLISPPINKGGEIIACLPGEIFAAVKTKWWRGEPDAILR